MDELEVIDWGNLRSNESVLCEFRPRPEYMGKILKPELVDKVGQLILLIPMWLMGEDDPYPGEYALSSPASHSALMRQMFGVAWLASGDFVRATTETKMSSFK